MGIFKEIIQEVSHNERDNTTIIENVESLSTNEIDRLVDYVIDEIKQGEENGGVTDKQELAHQALENVPGLETANDATIGAAIKKIEDGVAAKIKLNKAPKNK